MDYDTGTLKYLKVVGAELEEMLPLDNRYGAIVGFNGAHEVCLPEPASRNSRVLPDT